MSDKTPQGTRRRWIRKQNKDPATGLDQKSLQGNEKEVPPPQLDPEAGVLFMVDGRAPDPLKKTASLAHDQTRALP